MENPSHELRPGRLFIHGRLNDPMTGGPLYCRILAFEGGRVEFQTIYHCEDGSERVTKPSRLPLDGFLRRQCDRSRRNCCRDSGILVEQAFTCAVGPHS